MAKKYKRTIAALMSDSHAGHELGLLHPETEFELDDGHKFFPTLNPVQKHLWSEVYVPGVDDIVRLADGDEIILFHLGDISQGGTHIVEASYGGIAYQTDIALNNFRPWFEHPQVKKKKNVKKLRIAKGTPEHNFGKGSAEILSKRLLKGIYPHVDVNALYHGLASLSGITIDYAHHGPSQSVRKWLEGNLARYYLRDIMMKEILAKREPPSLVLRGHYHSYVKETLWIGGESEDYESTLIVVPSLCMIDEYARKITRSNYQITNGMVAVEIIDGQIYKTYKFAETIDIRTKEQL